jgi:hypothetical protein
LPLLLLLTENDDVMTGWRVAPPFCEGEVLLLLTPGRQ